MDALCNMDTLRQESRTPYVPLGSDLRPEQLGTSLNSSVAITSPLGDSSRLYFDIGGSRSDELVDGGECPGDTVHIKVRHRMTRSVFQSMAYVGIGGRPDHIHFYLVGAVVANRGNAHGADSHGAGVAEDGHELVVPVRGACHRYVHHHLRRHLL